MSKLSQTHISILFFVLSAVCFLVAGLLHKFQPVRMVSITPPLDMTSAGLYLANEITNPAGILVLCNGYNNCSGDLIRQPQWRQFAKEHRLVLAEIAFSSPEDRLTTVGYYYVWRGSGQALLTMLDKAYPQKPSLLMFGFSGGGQFVARFQEWCPERVAAWAVSGVNWWEPAPPDGEGYAPGIIAIGDLESRYPNSVHAFRSRLEKGCHILWCGMKDVGHSLPEATVELFRVFFAEMLSSSSPAWMSVDVNGEPAGGVPSQRVKEEWEKIERTAPLEE